jgi:hypothetical protein
MTLHGTRCQSRGGEPATGGRLLISRLVLGVAIRRKSQSSSPATQALEDYWKLEENAISAQGPWAGGFLRQDHRITVFTRIWLDISWIFMNYHDISEYFWGFPALNHPTSMLGLANVPLCNVSFFFGRAVDVTLSQYLICHSTPQLFTLQPCKGPSACCRILLPTRTSRESQDLPSVNHKRNKRKLCLVITAKEMPPCWGGIYSNSPQLAESQAWRSKILSIWRSSWHSSQFNLLHWLHPASTLLHPK